MFGLFTKKKEAPAWASFFTSEEYNYFESELKQYFDAHGYKYTLKDGVIYVEPDGELQGNYGLLNLAQKCYKYMMPAFSGIIQEHFDAVIQNQKNMSDFSQKINDFDAIKDLLSTRLYGPDMNGQNERGVRREFSTDIYETLVYDDPSAVILLTQKMIQSWGKSEDFLFGFGRKNVVKKYSFPSKTVDIDGAQIIYFSAEHYFVPNIILDIENHPELIGSLCTLVAIPTRSEALFFPINLHKDRANESVIFQAAHQYFNKGPGSLTDRVLFYQNGKYYNYGFTRNGDELILLPPEQFL